MKLLPALVVPLLTLVTLVASAEPMLVQNRHSIEWDNNSPEQRQALDNFYRSLEQQQLHNLVDQRVMRQQRLEQLRDMTPEQRQQQMIDFAQQYQQQRQLLMPTQ